MKAVVLTFLFLTTLTIGIKANNNEDKLPKRFSVSGKVHDSNENLTGVKVILDGKETVVYTDFEGNFTLENIVEGEHTISFSLITYESKEVTLDLKDVSTLEVELKEK
ncbi:MAG: carboxypeptidase-like regulatory domain-containing protein [Flavobacteriales bacterium]|nr:carboxypeptidase-like regulatory domain-containing protein [Flavobacteriales bacterium]